MWRPELAAPKNLNGQGAKLQKHIGVDSLQSPLYQDGVPLPAAAKICMQSKMGGHWCQPAFLPLLQSPLT